MNLFNSKTNDDKFIFNFFIQIELNNIFTSLVYSFDKFYFIYFLLIYLTKNINFL